MVTQLLCTVLCDLSIEYWGVILNLMGFLCFDTMAARLQLCMNLIAFARGELNGRCVVAEEIGDRDKDTMHPLK